MNAGPPHIFDWGGSPPAPPPGSYAYAINSQECKSFEIDTVTIKKSMTEYHHLINSQGLVTFYSNAAVYGGNEYGKSRVRLCLTFEAKISVFKRG